LTSNLSQYNDILAIQQNLHLLKYEHWRQYELFTWQWWTILGMLIIPWIVWWRLVDKSRTATILCYGLYLMIVVSALDLLGVGLQLWAYPITLIPTIPIAIPLNCGMMPVAHMLIYQYLPRWKSFLIAEIIVSALGAFVAEPLVEKVGIYLALHWHHIWSFPIYMMKAVIGKLLIECLVSRR
jgi:hypothetical protein